MEYTATMEVPMNDTIQLLHENEKESCSVKKTSSLDKALADLDNGNVFIVHTPKKWRRRTELQMCGRRLK
jgi:hypothetical protein